MTRQGLASRGIGVYPATQLGDHAFLEHIAGSRISTWCWPDCSRGELFTTAGVMQALGYGRGEPGSELAQYRELVHPGDRVRLAGMVREILRHQRAEELQVDIRVKTRGGPHALVRIVASVTRHDAPPQISAFGIARVLPDGEQLDHSRLRVTEDALYAVLNEIGHPVVLMAADGVVLQQNDAATQLFGARLHDPGLGSRYCPFLHEPDGTSVNGHFLQGVIETGERSDQEVRRFGRWWHIYLVPLRNAEGQVGQLLLLAQDISGLKAEQAAELAREKTLTQTLVREVHHRIKNHLQGLIGLLRSHSGSERPLREVIDEAVAHIQSIATVHGLLATGGDGTIEFPALLTRIITTLRKGAGVPVRCNMELPERQPLAISSEEAVPIAVAVGELVMNAIKHTARRSGAYVEGRLSYEAGQIQLTVTNFPAQLPAGLRQSAAGTAHAGLDLVRALLPRNRSALEIFQDGSAVTARLLFTPKPHPSISPESARVVEASGR